jgi:hypothetical protein
MFDKTTTNAFAADLQKAFNEVAAKHGVTAPKLDLRRARDGSFARLMKVDIQAAGTKVTSLKVDSQFMGLEAAMKRFGITSTKNAKGDVLDAFNPRSPKFCFSYTSARGTQWKCTAEQAKKRFG